MHLINKDKVIKENCMYVYWEDAGNTFHARKKIASGRYTGGYPRKKNIRVHPNTIVMEE